jgi:hypothetical protein
VGAQGAPCAKITAVRNVTIHPGNPEVHDDLADALALGVSLEELSAAKAEKVGYGLNTISFTGRSRIHEFPDTET